MRRSHFGSMVLILAFAALLAVPALAAPLTLTSVSPPYAVNTRSVTLMVWGSGFSGSPGSYHATNPSITLRKAGEADITVAGSKIYLYPNADEIGYNTFPLTGAAPGVWDVVVTNNDGETATLPGAFTVVEAPATPTVTAISPVTAPNTGPVDVTITGTNFFVPPAADGPVMTAKLTHGTPYGSITATNVTVTSPTEMTCTFDVTGAGWGPDSPWSVVVQQPWTGPSGTLSNAFTVTNVGAPTVTSITPETGSATASLSVTIRGTNFLGVRGYNAGNPLVTLRQAGQADRTISRNYVYFTDSTQISGTLPVSGAPLGTWDVIVTNYDGQSATLPAAFTVYASPKPTVTAITPSSGAADSTVNITNLAGTGFLAGSTVKLTAAGQPDIAASNVVVASGTKITCSFDLTGAAPGARDVTVTLPDGQSGTKTNAFTVFGPAPVVTAISPDNGANNTTVDATISGSGFLPGATATLGGIPGTDLTVVSSTQITASFAIALPATGGGNKLDVTVTNPGSLPGTLAGGFTVNYPAPTVTAVTPPYALNTGVVALSVTGTGFLGSPGSYHASNPTLTLRKAGSPDISRGGTSIYMYPDGTRIGTNSFPLSGAADGVYDVIVTNSDGQSATLPAAFTVYSSYGTPTVTSITPSTATNTGTVDVTITGTGFFVPPAPGGPTMTAKLTHTTPYGTINATNVTVVSATEMTCTFDVTNQGWGAESPWNLVVQQPSSGASATLNNAFTITNAGVLTVMSISPNTGVSTTYSPTVTITGTGFMGVSGYNSGNPVVTMRKAGEADRTVTVGYVYYTDPTQIRCTLPVNGAALGVWDIVVTNWDGASATLTGGFTVYATARPTVSAITPSSGTVPDTVAITSLTGTGFLAGSTVKLSAAGQPDIAGTDVVVTSATKITCSFDLTGASAGPKDVTVTLPDGQFGTKANAFTVNHGPAVSLTLDPAEQTVAAGGTASYTATAQDAAGNSWDATSETVFSADVRAGGSWAGAVYTSETAGDWPVAGNYGGVVGTALLHVTSGVAASLTIAPADSTATAGDAVTYTATAGDAAGNTWDVTGDTTFGIDTEAGGSWAANVYTSQRTGDWTVNAQFGALTASTALYVGPAAITSLTLSPDPGSAVAGDNVTYTVTATDGLGNTWDATADTTFGIDAGAGGSFAANVYASETAGQWIVTADCDGVTATAALTVTASAPVSLTLSPNPGTVQAGGAVIYTATAGDAQGNIWDATADTTFGIEAGAGGSFAANVYTAGAAGQWTVTGDLGAGVSATAALTVTAPPDPDAYEVDDSSAEAKNIAAGETQERNIHAINNRDFARFTLTEKSDVTIETAGVAGDTVMWVYGTNGGVVGYDDDGGTGAFSRIQIAGAGPGTYFIRVQEANSQTLAAYTLSLNATAVAPSPTPDAYEADDTSAAAKVITPGESQDRTIHAAGNRDFVKFTLAEKSDVTIETAGAEGDTEMWVYGPNGSMMGYDNDGGTGAFSRIQIVGAVPGTYFIRVQEAAGQTIAAYTLSLTATAVALPTPDAYEVDDTSAAAKVIAGGEVQNRSIHVAGNRDWAKFTLSEPSAVTVTASDNTCMWLYAASGPQMGYDAGNGISAGINAPLLAAGTYFIRVQARGYASTVDAYTLQLDAVALEPIAADAYEVDDTSASAKPISAGESQSRSIHVIGNTDWARFTISEAATVTVSATGNTQLWVYRSSGQLVQSAPGNGTVATAGPISLPAGNYFIRVAGRAGTVDAYSLDVTIAP